jgi:hypothetical protein
LLKKKLLIFGAGGHGRSVAEAVLINPLLDIEVLGFVDDWLQKPESEENWSACAAIFPALRYQKSDWR